MKQRIISLSLVSAFILAGCGGNNGEPLPVPPTDFTTPPTATTEAPKPRPSNTEPSSSPTTVKPSATLAPSTSSADTPAVQFARRWGLKYPGIPEVTILKTANAVCEVTKLDGNWQDNPQLIADIKEKINSAGFPDEETYPFATDAETNYCSSLG